MPSPIVKNFLSYHDTIPQILEESNLKDAICNQKQILIKPNLTIDEPPPCTTHPELVEEVVKYIQAHSKTKIIIAEGSGGCETTKAFDSLGYTALAKKYHIDLIDLNSSDRVELENPNAKSLKSVKLPKIALESYIINLPVLKIHSDTYMTAAMKNIFGFYLNDSFLLKDNGIWRTIRKLGFGWWNKSELHFSGINDAIIDLNNYIEINYSLVDASIGQDKSEVHGIPFDPPLGKIIAGYDLQSVDQACAAILNLKNKVKYLQ